MCAAKAIMFSLSRCLCRASMDSCVRQTSPLHTCANGGIIRPRVVLSCLVLTVYNTYVFSHLLQLLLLKCWINFCFCYCVIKPPPQTIEALRNGVGHLFVRLSSTRSCRPLACCCGWRRAASTMQGHLCIGCSVCLPREKKISPWNLW